MKTDRRNFIIPAVGLATVAHAFPLNEKTFDVALPGCDIKMSKLGFGTGTIGWLTKNARWAKNNPNRKKLMEDSDAIDLFHRCYERGINFFDLADGYGTHGFCKEALRSIPRDKVALMTKFWWADAVKGTQRTEWIKATAKLSISERKQYVKKDVDRFLRELNTDYIDMMLIHLLFDRDWIEPMKPYMDVLSEYKEKGVIKTLGVSCHDYGAMETAVESPWVDVLLARINPYGVKCDGSADEVLKVLKQGKKNGKFIIGMKIYGDGQLSDDRDKCMKFAQTSKVLDAMTIGMNSTKQIDDNLKLFKKHAKS